MTTGTAWAMYLVGVGVAFLVVGLWLAWCYRKELVMGTMDWGDSGVVPAFLFLPAMWPMALCVAVCVAVIWILSIGIARGMKRTAARLITIETRAERRQQRKALEEKAGQEIFDEVDRMLRDSTKDEITSFMSQLKVRTA